MPKDKGILFLPAMFLGSFVQRETGHENMHIGGGMSHVHAGIVPDQVEDVLTPHPEADLLVHPECGCSTSSMYLESEGVQSENKTHILSTVFFTCLNLPLHLLFHGCRHF
ncbi:quinolinate synthase NadA [Virgibacillus sp. FSP13]